MNSLYLKIAMTVLTQMPQIAQDIQKAIQDAESTEAAKDKVKALLGDAQKFLGVIAEAL